MAKGRAKKSLNKRTHELQRVLYARHTQLKDSIQAAKKGKLNIDELNQLKRALHQPVKLSETLSIEMEDCYPSAGKYKRALPKGYCSDITAINQAITRMQSPTSLQVSTVALETPDAMKMNGNIFVLIEEYLSHPCKKLADRIKKRSHDVTNEAYEQAKVRFPDKYKKDNLHHPVLDKLGNKRWLIGADEYAPILLDRIQTEAREAMAYSTRMVKNKGYTVRDKIDKAYLFKVSQDQQGAIHSLIGELLTQKGSNVLHPDGLIFAFDGYIERRSTSSFTWIEGVEAAAYDHNATLYLKAKELAGRGAFDVAKTVADGCKQIKEVLDSDHALAIKRLTIKNILVGLQQDPNVQQHRGILKTVLTNFILLVSGVGLVYLAATAEKRGSFFYRPKTETENIAKVFEDNIEQSFK